MSSDYLSRLGDLEDRFSTFAKDVRQGRRAARYEERRDKAWKRELVEIVEAVAGVVGDAEKAGPGNLEDVLEKAEALLNPAITIAYEGWDYQLFESLESFAHGDQRPLAKLDLVENVHRMSSTP